MEEYTLKLNEKEAFSEIQFELSEDKIYRMSLIESNKGTAEKLAEKVSGLMQMCDSENIQLHFNISLATESGAALFRVTGNVDKFIELARSYDNVLSPGILKILVQDKNAQIIISNTRAHRFPANVRYGRVLSEPMSPSQNARNLMGELFDAMSKLSSDERSEIEGQIKGRLSHQKSPQCAGRNFFGVIRRK